jgi:hypothetical protein
MIDVNQITSTLRGMPDQQLQQYAMMHKGDPYILSLAVSESNQRKQLRTAAQGQGGGQQMPKVADSAIAGMTQQQLPENQGIAQIPTPNMQRLADGGIAGYEDDQEGMATGGMGGMFNFAQQSEPVVRMSGGGHIPRYQGNTTDGSVVGGIPGFQAVQPRAQFTQQGAPENTPFFQRMLENIGSGNKDRQLAMIEQKIAQGTATPEEKAYFQTEMGKKSGQKQMGAPKDVVNPDEVLMATEKAGRNKAAVDKAAADKAPVAKPAPQGNLPTSGTSVKQAQDLSSKFYDLKGIEGKLEQAQMQERQDIANEKDARAAKVEAFNKEQGPAMASYEKLLKGEEMQDATDKEKAGLMSLMKGFLAMAAGESPNAATNIAKGAMVGLGDYGDALKEFKKSAKDRNKAMAEIENARRAEAKGDLKDAQIYEDKANDYMRASKQSGIKAIIDATGKSSEISAGLYKSAAEIASANARTMAQINAPDAQSKFYGNLGGGDPKKGLAYFAETMGPDAKGLQAILKDYSGMVGEARLKAMETSQDPAERSKAATIRQLQKEQLVGGIKPVNVAQDRNLLP